MADDYEDVEQLYLFANVDSAAERGAGIAFPRQLLAIRFPLREMIDKIANMLREGYIEAKYSNDAELAPLHLINFSALHHYWFGATEKGLQGWKTRRTDS
jgi:hypothetical protein